MTGVNAGSKVDVDDAKLIGSSAKTKRPHF